MIGRVLSELLDTLTTAPFLPQKRVGGKGRRHWGAWVVGIAVATVLGLLLDQIF